MAWLLFNLLQNTIMSSINQQQPEQNHKDLEYSEAIKKIKELCENKTCFFCTSLVKDKPFETRPMHVLKIEDDGTFLFLSADDSKLNLEILMDDAVQLLFQGSAHSDFVNVYGHASVSKDKDKIKELYNPMLKTWFTGGEDDPRITVISFSPKGGYYWDNKHGNLVAFAKQIAGAVMGKTLDDSIEGTLKL